MVPGSTLMYGSSFWMETLKPLSLNSLPIAAAVTPLPTLLTTPPVRKMNFVMVLPPRLPGPKRAVGRSFSRRPPHRLQAFALHRSLQPSSSHDACQIARGPAHFEQHQAQFGF